MDVLCNLLIANYKALKMFYFHNFFKVFSYTDSHLTKNVIAPIFLSDDTNIISTLDNQDNALNTKASLFLLRYPFPTNIFRLRLRSEVFHQIDKQGDFSWNHTGYSIIPSVYLAYNKWGL